MPTINVNIHTLDRTLLPDLFLKDRFRVGDAFSDSRGITITLTGVNKDVQIPLGGFPEVLSFVIQFGSGVASGIVGNWLYDRLKTKSIAKLEIERTVVELEQGAITKVISEKISQSGNK